MSAPLPTSLICVVIDEFDDLQHVPAHVIDRIIATEGTADDWLFIPSFLETLPQDIEKRKAGRPSIVSKHPEVLETIQQMITQNSAAAQSRRRDATAYSFGTSLSQLRTRIRKRNKVKMSRSTIHRILIAPHRRYRSAKYYRGLINARVPRISNCRTTKDHADFRYTCVEVNTVNEMAALFRDEVLSLSCDDKNKVNIGATAVNRQRRYQSFFDGNNLPDLPDHDFPYRNSKLTPSGYLVLTSTEKDKRSRSSSPPRRQQRSSNERRRSISPSSRYSQTSPPLTVDSSGRNHVVWPREGPLHMFLHSDKYFPSTSPMHLNHLLGLLPPLLTSSGKTVVTIVCDGGPDWRTDSPCNMVNYGRLWRDLGLDVLILTSYSPYHSRYNPVESGFSYLTKWLAGTILPIPLPGEDEPPQQQDIPQAERDTKEKLVHTNAMEMCAQIWSGREWDGFPVTTTPVPCDGSSLRYRNHDRQTKLTVAPLRSLKGELKDVAGEYKFAARHLTRKTYQLEYAKCQDLGCGHCVQMPVKAVRVMNYLKKHGGTIPTPTLSGSHPGHYKTFLESLQDASHGPQQIVENLQSAKASRKSCRKGTNCQQPVRTLNVITD